MSKKTKYQAFLPGLLVIESCIIMYRDNRFLVIMNASVIAFQGHPVQIITFLITWINQLKVYFPILL